MDNTPSRSINSGIDFVIMLTSRLSMFVKYTDGDRKNVSGRCFDSVSWHNFHTEGRKLTVTFPQRDLVLAFPFTEDEFWLVSNYYMSEQISNLTLDESWTAEVNAILNRSAALLAEE